MIPCLLEKATGGLSAKGLDQAILLKFPMQGLTVAS